jgi:hypothetical protein
MSKMLQKKYENLRKYELLQDLEVTLLNINLQKL